MFDCSIIQVDCVCQYLLFGAVLSDAKEIDPSDIEMKERLGAGQFGVSIFHPF